VGVDGESFRIHGDETGDALEERILIAKVLRGDAEAERLLYERHVDRVFRLAWRMAGDATQAEDLTQDVFIRAFDRLADYRGDAPFGAWLHRVAVTVILGALRKRRRIQAVESLRDDLEPLGASVPAADPDLKRRLASAVDGLDDPHRLVFVMHDMEGFTHQEIAAAMDTPVGTAKARLSRARRKLRAALTAGPGPEPEWSLE
jgi:RNA polymerase sigma-70 factor (ECF subfamily)